MRKKAEERKRCVSPSPSSSSASSNDASSSVNGAVSELTAAGVGGHDVEVKGYTMDQIWNEIAASESVSNLRFEELKDGSACSMDYPPMSASPIWEECSGPLWRIDDEDIRMLSPMTDLLVSKL